MVEMWKTTGPLLEEIRAADNRAQFLALGELFDDAIRRRRQSTDSGLVKLAEILEKANRE
jgi:hypothetical protein